MTPTTTVHIGVDVSKHHLDLSTFDRGPRRIANDLESLRKLIRRIAALEAEVVVTCEASGGYEKALVATLLTAEVPVSRVNPAQVKAFIRSQAVGAKTDAMDAEMIARFAAVREQAGRLFLVDISEAARTELRELIQRRLQLQEMLLQEENRLDPAPARAVAKDIRAHVRQLKIRLQRIEEAIDQWIEDHPELKEIHRRLNEVQGLGRITSLTLIAFVPELGKVSDKRVASLVGLAPYNRDSGLSRKPMHIQGGRTVPRRILYMASVAAVRWNPILRAFYQRLRENGKPAKVALIAVARKLLVLANRIAANPQFNVQ